MNPGPSLLLACAPETLGWGMALLGVVKLFLLHAPILFLGFAAARALLKGEPLLPRAVAALVIYFSSISISVWVLPRISYFWLLGWSLANGAAGAAIWIKWPAGPPKPADEDRSLIGLAGFLAMAILSAALLAEGILMPRFHHDPLTYQLYFAASWLREGRLFIAPTPFGDPSQAYGAANASVYYLWLMAPLTSDLLAADGAWPFLVLALLSASALAMELGTRKDYVWAAALFTLSAPLLMDQGQSALSDLPVAAFFIAALGFCLGAVNRRTPARLFLALLAAGLAAGFKFTALGLLLILAPALALAAISVRGRGSRAAGVAGLAAGTLAGGLWYLRNLVLAGNPVFPIRVSVFGYNLLPGTYGQQEMMNWIYHRQGFRAWLATVMSNASPVLLTIGLAAMVMLLLKGIGPLIKTSRGNQEPEAEESPPASRQRNLFLIYLALVPILIDRLSWNLMPFQVARFWIPAAATIAAPAAWMLSRRPRLIWPAMALAWINSFLFPPWTLLATNGETARLLLKIAAPFLAIGLGFLLAPGRKRLPAPGPKPAALWPPRPAGLAALLTLCFLIFLALAQRGHDQRRGEALAGYESGGGWSQLPCPAEGTTVAYTGANVPYPLFGPRLKNHVLYISPAGEIMPRDHELWKRSATTGPQFNTPEPELSGLNLCPRRWTEAIISSRTRFLFVMRVPAVILLNWAHSPDDWPREDSWARSNPRLFRPAYQDAFTRSYEVLPAGPEALAGLPSSCQRRPVDALAVCARESADCSAWFPLARLAMNEIGIVFRAAPP